MPDTSPIHICRYRTLAPDTYFCPTCRQLVFRGRVIVVPVLSDEDQVASLLWINHAQQVVEQGLAVFEQLRAFAPPSAADLEQMHAQLVGWTKLPLWRQRLRMGPRQVLRSRRGLRYVGPAHRIALGWRRATAPARAELRRLGINSLPIRPQHSPRSRPTRKRQ